MSKTQKDFIPQKLQMKTLNILFFALILLCSYSTVLNKLKSKNSKETLKAETQNNWEFPSLNFSSIFNKGEQKNQTHPIKQKQKRFEFEVAQLDTQNQTLNVSELNLTSDALNCYKKFELVINNFPLTVQSEIVSEFQNYFVQKQTADKSATFDASLCCLSRNLIKKASSKVNAITKAFTGLVSQQESECKNGFACFRGNEILVKALGKEIDSGYKNKNQETLKNLLKDGKTQNSNLIKCLVHLQKISTRNLGLMCANDGLLNKTFVFNAENKIVRPKRFPEDDLDFFTNCGEYVKNFNLYPEEITNAFVDSLNFLLGSEQCNYFSNFFAVNNRGRKPLNPKMFSKKNEKKNVLEKSKDFFKGLFGDSKANNSTKSLASSLSSNKNGLLSELKQKLSKGESTAALIEKWAKCASAEAEFAKESVENLKKELPLKLAENPSGLLGGKVVGVNFKEIQSKFDASSNSRFLLSCEAATGCKLNLGANSNSNGIKDKFNATNVVTRTNIAIDYSCCDRICVISYSNKNNYTNASNVEAEYQNDEEANEVLLNEEITKFEDDENSAPVVEFLQVEKNEKSLTNKNRNENKFFDKILSSIGLNKNGTNPIRRRPKLILAAAEVFEIKPFNEYAQRTTQKDTEKIKSALRTLKSKPENVSFADENLLKEINEYAENPKNFLNDARIKTALLLNIKLENGNLTTLADFLLKDLAAIKGALHFSCATGKCSLAQSGQESKTFELAPNTNYSQFESEAGFAKKLLKKAEKDLANFTKVNNTQNLTENGFFKGVKNFFGSKKSEAEKAGKDAFGNFKAQGKKNLLNRFNRPEHYYRPNYNDSLANYTLDSLDAESIKMLLNADISRFAIRYLARFNKTLFLEDLNNNFNQSFSLEVECSEYFCVLVAKSASGLLKSSEENATKALLLKVHQRKAFSFDTKKLSITQKKCIIKHVLLNGRQEPEFFDVAGVPEVDLNNLQNLTNFVNNTLNSTIDSALSVANKTTTNIIQKCNLETPYTDLPISSDCLSSLVGHCQKSNFFDLYNRYTRGIASYDDLPAASAAQNSCVSPAECANVNNNSTKEEKGKCGAAISNLLFVNGSRLSLAKLVTPCNGDLPAASVEPISFAALESKKARSLKNRKMKKSSNKITDSNNNSDYIDYNSLSEEQKTQLTVSKSSADQNTETNVSIDGVTQDPNSVKVENDLAAINANVEESQKSVEVQVEEEKASNGAESLRFGFYTVVMILFALLI